MSRQKYFVCLLALAGGAAVFHSHSTHNLPKTRPLALNHQRNPGAKTKGNGVSNFEALPLAFEPNVGQAGARAQFVGRGQGITVLLTQEGIAVIPAMTTRRHNTAGTPNAGWQGDSLKIGFHYEEVFPRSGKRAGITWAGEQRLTGESNYFLGRDSRNWRTRVPHFAAAEAMIGADDFRGNNRVPPGREQEKGEVGVEIRGDKQGFEYDLRVPPGGDVTRLRLSLAGARRVRLDASGDLWASVGESEIRMGKPSVYEELLQTGSSPQGQKPGTEKVKMGNGVSASQITGPKRRRRGSSVRKRPSGKGTGSARRERRYRNRRKIRGGNSRPPAMRRPRRDAPRRPRKPTRQNGPAPTRSRGTRASQPEFGLDLAPEAAGEKRSERKTVESGYLLEADGTIGFRVGPHDAGATLVIDPSISIAYSTFLGGSGSDAANSVAMDSAGNVYVGGTTTSATTFTETGSTTLGPGGGASDLFIAKIDPSKSGASSLVYLTFLGGSGTETGGIVAVDSKGNLAVAGTTTSSDFPVTDGSKLTTGSNDVTVTEIDPTGSKLVYSTIFGGNGAEAAQGAGGIALDGSGNIFVASDTSSTDLPVTAGAFQQTYGGGTSDGFLAIFQPVVSPHLKYCTYLGIDAQAGASGVAVDASGNAYLAGYTTNPGTTFPAKNAFQPAYGGDPDDAFLMEISPSGKGATDLVFATLLGGSGLDEAYAVAVDTATPPNVYVTGMTASINFPTNGAIAAYQANLHTNATANAFLSVVTRNATGMTSLAYSSYLGGSETDSGESLAVTAANSVYVAGSTSSFDFPWLNNLQPYNGDGDAFVAKLDPTSAGAASLVYSTPLGGVAPAGGTVSADAAGIASDGAGHVIVAGQTTATDFPSAGSPGNGFQLICGSCQQSPPASDAFVVEIQESAVLEPSIYFSTANLNFGMQYVGATNVPPQFTAVYNGGETPLQISNIGITGPNSGDFSLINPGGCLAAPISPGSSCSFGVGFVPSTVGPEAAAVSFTDNAPGNPQVLEAIGTGEGPLATLSPASANFGNQPEGTQSAAMTITLTNTGNETLTIVQVVVGGANAVQFPPEIRNSCVNETAVNVGASCTFGVNFAPTATGTFTGEIDFFDNSGGVAGSEQIVPLTGVGTPPAPIANLQPTALVFGTENVGSSTAAQTVSLTNVGSAGLNVTGISITGSNAADFGIVATGNSPCPVTSGTVAIGATCTIGVVFSPQTAGNKAATVSFADDAAGTPQLVSLSGTAIAPVIQISPGSLIFSGQSVGTTSAAQTITLTNTGSSTLSINGIGITGANSGDFAETDNCTPSRVLGPGTNCVINVTFKPTETGNRTATLNVTDNAAGSPQPVPLTGTGTQAGILFQPASISFGNQLVGASSAPVTITVTNNGTGALVFSGISATGTNASDFAIGSDSCLGTNVSVAPNGTCTLQVTFTPACGISSAARAATLALTDNAPGSPQNIPLGGTATGSFCITGTTSVTVLAGITATYSMNAGAANGYAGNVALVISGCPPSATCTAPASVNVAGSAESPFTVQIATSSGVAAADRIASRAEPGRPGASFPDRQGKPIGLIVFPMALVCAAHIRRKSLRRWTRMVAFAALAGVALGACGGGNSGSVGGGDPGTPPGTYTVTLTGTANSSTQSVALTLTVQP